MDRKEKHLSIDGHAHQKKKLKYNEYYSTKDVMDEYF